MRSSPALAERWWIDWRNRQPVRGALERAFLYHWSEEVQAGLEANRQAGRTPSNWEQLGEALGVGSERISSDGTGLETLATPAGQLIVAELLGRELKDLAPTVQRWLQTAVANLLGQHLDEPAIADYVAFRLGQGESAVETDSGVGETVPASKQEAEIAEEVVEIAQQIDVILGADNPLPHQP